MGWIVKNKGWWRSCEGRIMEKVVSYPWIRCVLQEITNGSSMRDIKYGYMIRRAASDVLGQVRDFYLSEGHN
jgi:hypothetical protein